jgi:hypothetical protein
MIGPSVSGLPRRAGAHQGSCPKRLRHYYSDTADNPSRLAYALIGYAEGELSKLSKQEWGKEINFVRQCRKVRYR